MTTGIDSCRSTLVRWVIPLLGGAMALVILFLFYADLDFARFIDELARAHKGWILLLAASILLEFLAQGWKWRQLLYDLKPVGSLRLAAATLAGYGANTLVPLGVGPFVRAWIVARQENLRMASVLITTAIGRFVDGIVFALMAIAVAVSGQVATLEGEMQTALLIAGLLNLALFTLVLWMMFGTRQPLARDDTRLSRLIDWVASKNAQRFGQLRAALAGGLIWPTHRLRQLAVIAGSLTAKAIAATHFVWAGFAIGVTLGLFDYLLVMVVAGFALILARLLRVPGGFVVGAGFALKLLEVPDEQALAMILFSHVLATLLVVSLGLLILWQSGVDIRRARPSLDKSR